MKHCFKIVKNTFFFIPKNLFGETFQKWAVETTKYINQNKLTLIMISPTLELIVEITIVSGLSF